ncbi:MAG: penicillin acylase family protein [Sandaracinus sp.]|nr:penicillin acylase family protein [Sandaracinus sp.]
MAADDDLQNDPHYIGGPWHEDFRAARIDAMLTDSDTHDEESMARAQADVRSPLGELMTPLLLEALDEAKRLDETDGPLTEREGRSSPATRRGARPSTRCECVWALGGGRLPRAERRGHELPPERHPEERANAVATSIFNAWLGPFDARVLGDERFPESTFTPTGSGGRMRTMTRLIEGRGAANPLSLASFDVTKARASSSTSSARPRRRTRSRPRCSRSPTRSTFSRRRVTENAVASAPRRWTSGSGPPARRVSDALVADFLEGDDSLSFLADTFSITTEQIPLADDLAETDPRFGLTGFPRPGDNFVVDAANSGFSGTRFSFGSIPVFRMVIALRGDATTGRNVLPGGSQAVPPRRITRTKRGSGSRTRRHRCASHLRTWWKARRSARSSSLSAGRPPIRPSSAGPAASRAASSFRVGSTLALKLL